MQYNNIICNVLGIQQSSLTYRIQTYEEASPKSNSRQIETITEYTERISGITW